MGKSIRQGAKDILSFFPKDKAPREGQRSALEDIEKEWWKKEVHVIEIPTAGGKSACAETIAKYAASLGQKSTLIVPTNMLVDQGVQSSGFFTLKKKHEYQCIQNHAAQSRSCAEYQKDNEKLCHGCSYTQACRKARVFPYKIQNYYSYMAHKLYSDVLIIDECHLIIKMLQDLNAKKLWYRDYKFPHNVRTYQQLLSWTEALLEEKSEDKKLQTLYQDLHSGKNRFLVEKGVDRLYGREEALLKLLPIDTSQSPPILWPPGKVKKIILLSATVGKSDIQQMGLAQKTLAWTSVPSPIEAWRRPLIIDSVCKLNYGCPDSEYDKLVAYCEEVMRLFPNHKGLIHLPYGLVDKVQWRFSDEARERLLFHSRDNKKQKFDEFQQTSRGVLVCSGLYEGIDLPGDAGRFQVIGKVPWPSLADSAVKYMAETDGERYQWECLRTVVQATGRICRLQNDVGYSFLCDTSFSRLDVSLYPGYFRDAVEAGELWKNHSPVAGQRTPSNTSFYV